MPEYEEFIHIVGLFDNPYPLTTEFVGSVFKMPKDVVPDPRMRYIEAVAYIPSGIYKSRCNVASGTKDEIIATIQTEAFVGMLRETYRELTEFFEHYD